MALSLAVQESHRSPRAKEVPRAVGLEGSSWPCVNVNALMSDFSFVAFSLQGAISTSVRAVPVRVFCSLSEYWPLPCFSVLWPSLLNWPSLPIVRVLQEPV